MGGPNRGGRGAGQKATQATHQENKKNKKNKKNANSQNSESSDSDNSKKSSEDLSKESDLNIAKEQARDDYIHDEIFTETDRRELEVSGNNNPNLNPSSASIVFNAAPGDECRTRAKMITKRHHTAKRRRHSLDEDTPISEQIFDEKSFEEQTIIVVTNLSTDIDNLRLSYLKESRAIRGEIKSGQTKLETAADNSATKIEALKASLKELKTESEDGKKRVHDLVTAVQTLSTMVEKQNTTINGLITGKVELKDTTGLQHKINEVMKAQLDSLSATVIKYSDRNLGVTQSRTNEIKTTLSLLKTQDQLGKSLGTNAPRKTPNSEPIVIDEETPSTVASSSGANADGTHNVQKLTIPGKRPGQPPPPKTYATTAKTNLEAGLPVGAPPTGQRYNHKLNNNATFERMEAEAPEPEMVRRDFATFPDGNIKWNVHYEPKKPELTETQKKRRKTKWEKDREKTDKEVLIFMIPTRDAEGQLHSRDYDNAQVKRLFKELSRGGYFLKPGDIVGTIRQIQNDRHPQNLPITVTCKDKETASNVITAASNIFLNGGRRAKADDEEKGRFGFFRPSLSEQERKAIKEKHRLKETPHGKGQAEIRQRKYDSHTRADEWEELVTEEYNGEEEEMQTTNQTDIRMTPLDTDAPAAQTAVIEDENLNKISDPNTKQAALEKENERFKKVIEEMSKQVEELSKKNKA